MSGTSMDGVDVALVETDGETITTLGPAGSFPYDPAFVERLRAIVGRPAGDDRETATVVGNLTDHHASAVSTFMTEHRLGPSDVDVVGFHGQTVFHAPEQGTTCQVGDAQRLADATGLAVVADFRRADVAAGGQGAPFAPLFHMAMAEFLEKPLAILNLGGVANLTFIGADGRVAAFDTGPANALIDDWIRTRTGRSFDRGGEVSLAGLVDDAILERLLDHPFFDAPPPKSLDRGAFSHNAAAGLGVEDGAATLAAFTARSVARALDHLPARPARWLVTGGGRHNVAIMEMLADALEASVEPVESVGWSGDALEAQAFAFLAVRSLRGLPLSLPTTTGVPAPMTGGRHFVPQSSTTRQASV